MRSNVLIAFTFIFALALIGVGNALADPPTIGFLTNANQTVIEDQPTHAIQLVLTDDLTPELSLQPSGVSDSQSVVPNQNIFFGQANGHWYTTITPVFGCKSGTATITVTITDTNAQSASTNFTLTVNPPSAGSARFYNLSPVTVPDLGPATTYPSVINVAGRSGTITNMTLTLSRLTHSRVQELNMLLVGPTTNMVIVSHVSNGNRSVTNITVHLSDDTIYPLPIDYALWSEPLWPTAYAPVVSFPAPAPAAVGPYGTNHFSSTFNGTNPNGTWSLYVYDDENTGNASSIAGGWSLMIATSGGGSLPPEISDITNQTIPINSNTGPIPFTINDDDTAAGSLTLTTSSSNPTLVPLSGIVLGGTGTNRTVTITPAANKIGTATITVRVGDGVNTNSDSFVLTVSSSATQVRVETAADGSGTVVPTQFRNPNSSNTVYAIARDNFGNFVTNVAGGSWSLTNITGDVVSGDLVAVGNSNSATFTSHAVGSAQIHVASGALTSVDSGTLTVLSSAQPTFLSGIPNKTNLVGIPLGPFSFTISDPDTSIGSLTLTGTSSDTNLVPNGNIILYNNGIQTLTVIPAAGQTGTTTITVNVGDNASTNSISFIFAVISPGAGTAIFDSPSGIAITNDGGAAPYPSVMNVSGMAGNITNLIVTLRDFSHPWPGNVSMLLVGPGGAKSLIFAGVAWGNFPATNMTVTLWDGAEYALPSVAALLPGTYRPACYTNSPRNPPPDTNFPPSAPVGPYTTSALSAFTGSPNGTWQLYVYDPYGGGPFPGWFPGEIAGGWSMAITTDAFGTAPTISDITNQSTTVNIPTAAIPFTINDAETAVSNLVLTASSSNPTLVPTNNIVFGGSGTNRTLTVTPNQVGTATITVTVRDGDTMTASDSFLLTVNPAALTVTVNSTNRVYGAANPTFTGSISGLQAGDSITLSLSNAAAPASPVGSYPINVTLNDPGNKLGNYVVTTNNGALTITPKGITVTAGSGQTKVFGTVDPALTYVSSDLGAVFSGALGRALGENVGSYAINVGTLTAGANYTISFVPANFAITKKDLVARADDQTRLYGQTNPVFTISYNGFVNGDNISVLDSLPTASTTATTASLSATYIIAVTGGADNNYALNLVDGTLTVMAPPYGTLSIVRLENNHMKISGYGDSNVTYMILGSLDMVSWEELGTATAAEDGVFEYEDSDAVNYTIRFYRTVRP